jgi:hypothetical protein
MVQSKKNRHHTTNILLKNENAKNTQQTTCKKTNKHAKMKTRDKTKNNFLCLSTILLQQ